MPGRLRETVARMYRAALAHKVTTAVFALGLAAIIALGAVAAASGSSASATGVSAVGLNSGQVGARARWGNPGNAKLRTVKLGNGATATAVLAITDVGVFPAKTCRQVMAAGLRVYPPGQSASRVIPYPFSACSTRQPFMTAGLVQKPK